MQTERVCTGIKAIVYGGRVLINSLKLLITTNQSSAMSATQNLRVDRTFNELEVGDIVFTHNSVTPDAIRYLRITKSTSEKNMKNRIHPTLILHKNTATRVMTGVVITSKQMSQIPGDKQTYFKKASDYIPGQQGVLIIAGLNEIHEGNPPHRVCCAFELNIGKNLIIPFNT